MLLVVKMDEVVDILQMETFKQGHFFLLLGSVVLVIVS